jgi:hypothetical protein
VASCSAAHGTTRELTASRTDIDYKPGRRNGKSIMWQLLEEWPRHCPGMIKDILPFCADDLCERDESGRSCLDVALATDNQHFVTALADLTSAAAADDTTALSGDQAGPSVLRLREQARALVGMKNGRGQTALLAAVRPYSFASQSNLAMVRPALLHSLSLSLSSRKV